MQESGTGKTCLKVLTDLMIGNRFATNKIFKLDKVTLKGFKF